MSQTDRPEQLKCISAKIIGEECDAPCADELVTQKHQYVLCSLLRSALVQRGCHPTSNRAPIAHALKQSWTFHELFGAPPKRPIKREKRPINHVW